MVFRYYSVLLNKLRFGHNFGQFVNFSTNSQIKSIKFKTCGQLYEELRQKNPKLYGNSPSDGVTVNVEYVDTFADKVNKMSGNVKTIVAIHGIPGYHHHFNQLIDYFSSNESNVRLIVPNLPDFRLTRQTMAFWHSNKERSQFIRDFLEAINISVIDCLISHSAGIHPISLIWSNPKDLKIESVGLFCPQPLWMSKYFFGLSKLFSNLAQNDFGIQLMDAFKPHIFAHRMGYPMNYANVDEVLLTIMIASNGLDQYQLHKRLEHIHKNKIKTLVVFGQRDRLILKESFKRLVRDLGADKKDFVVYSKDNSLEREPEREGPIKVLLFRNGGHFAYAKYHEEVNKHLVKHCLQL